MAVILGLFLIFRFGGIYINTLTPVSYVFLTVLAISIAARPADAEHPFGHGKAESIAAIIQAALIFTAGGLIISSAIRRIMGDATVELTEAGMGMMAVSIFSMSERRL